MLATLGVDHDVKEYPDAGHEFLNDHEGAGDRSPLIFVVMGKFAGPAGYACPVHGMAVPPVVGADQVEGHG